MKPKVYVETTILSYLAARPSRQPVTAGRQVITRQWWERRAPMRCISPQRQWKSVNFYLPGTSGISRTFEFAGKWRGFFRTMASGKTKCSKRFTRCGTPTRRSTANNLDQIYADLKRREASSDLRRSASRPLAKA